jgi:quaternary ammonium compound-resistance protein SugE
MNWIFLIIAGIFEICFAVSLKYAEGFTKLIPTVLFAVFALLSFFFLTKAIETIPIGTAYAVWTGIGACGITLIGIFYFNEPIDFWRVFFISTLIISIVGLKLISVNN